MKYKVVAIEKRKTREDKDFYSLTLGDEVTSTEIERVSAFENLDKIKVGAEIEGSIVENSAGYKNFRFPREAGVKGQSGNKSAQIQQVMDRKREDISQAMDKKQDAIRMSGAMRDATLMITMLIGAFPDEYRDWSADMIKTEWQAWRDYFLNSWDTPTQAPFN